MAIFSRRAVLEWNGDEALEGVDHAQLQEIAQERRERCAISIALEGTVAITYDIIAR